MAWSTFKIVKEYEICRHETGDGIYEHYEINEEDNNCCKTEEPQDELE